MHSTGWRKRVVLALCAVSMGSLLSWQQSGCLRTWQNNVEVLFAPQANPTLIRDSVFYQWFGPNILRFL